MGKMKDECAGRVMAEAVAIWPKMFSAYHREGYRASMEAKVADFVSDESAIPGTPVILVV